MWPGFDPQRRRDFETIRFDAAHHRRQMVRLSRQTPTREWPLVFEREHDELLVVREWPDGSVTAYMMPAADVRRMGGA